MSKYSRRKFLTHTGIAASAATQLGWLGNQAQAANTDGYRALVCILLAGGADSFNMLVPYDDDGYASYATARADLALPQTSLRPLNYAPVSGQEFAVHPGMDQLGQLFDSGDLAFVSNIGPLAEPTSRTAFDNAGVTLPVGLFSHSDQIAVWQTGAAGIRSTTGFAGRLADLVESQANSGPISMNISMAGTNLFQTGVAANAYAFDPRDGVRSLEGYAEPNNEIFTNAIDQLLSIDYGDPFRSTYSNQLRSSLDAGILFNEALAGAPTLTTSFSATGLSSALARVAQVISIRDALNVSRQTFFITFGGWDHHDEVLQNQAEMLPMLSQGIAEFTQAMTELGLAQDVTTFTISDFGRTLTSNGRGSDHGWGGNNLVVGGAVNGQRILGDFPDLTIGSELDLGRGRLLPTTSTDVFYADLAQWFGLNGSEIATVLPNANRFYDTSASSPPLGLFTT